MFRRVRGLSAVLLALPIMALIASLIRRDGGPVFIDRRVEIGGKLFSAPRLDHGPDGPGFT